ncbi:MAG: hypothetical protein ACOC58_02580 [Chloroflexota bacterium]
MEAGVESARVLSEKVEQADGIGPPGDSYQKGFPTLKQAFTLNETEHSPFKVFH